MQFTSLLLGLKSAESFCVFDPSYSQQLRRIFGPKKDEAIGTGQMANENVNNLYVLTIQQP
jgi:hypothetical protein